MIRLEPPNASYLRYCKKNNVNRFGGDNTQHVYHHYVDDSPKQVSESKEERREVKVTPQKPPIIEFEFD